MLAACFEGKGTSWLLVGMWPEVWYPVPCALPRKALTYNASYPLSVLSLRHVWAQLCLEGKSSKDATFSEEVEACGENMRTVYREARIGFFSGEGEGQQGLVLSALLSSHCVVHRGWPWTSAPGWPWTPAPPGWPPLWLPKSLTTWLGYRDIEERPSLCFECLLFFLSWWSFICSSWKQANKISQCLLGNM